METTSNPPFASEEAAKSPLSPQKRQPPSRHLLVTGGPLPT